MEVLVVLFSETSVNFYQTTRRRSREGNTIRGHRRKDLKCHAILHVGNIMKVSSRVWGALSTCFFFFWILDLLAPYTHDSELQRRK
jgi:hypothetical protein